MEERRRRRRKEEEEVSGERDRDRERRKKIRRKEKHGGKVGYTPSSNHPLLFDHFSLYLHKL